MIMSQITKSDTFDSNSTTAQLSRRAKAPPAGFGTKLSAEPDPIEESQNIMAQPVMLPLRELRPAILEPTPAEMFAITLLQAPKNNLQAHGLKGDPDLIKLIEKLFGFADVVIFKDLMLKFKNNVIDSAMLLNQLLNLALASKSSNTYEKTIDQLGIIWHRLSDSLPESKVDLSQNTLEVLDKKKKKGISLKEFEAIRKGIPKKEAMLREWNDFKALVKIVLTLEETICYCAGLHKFICVHGEFKFFTNAVSCSPHRTAFASSCPGHQGKREGGT